MLVKRQKVGFNLWIPDGCCPSLNQNLQLIKFFLRFRLLLLTETLAVFGKIDEIPHQKGILQKVATKVSGSITVSATRFARPTCLLVVCETNRPPPAV